MDIRLSDQYLGCYALVITQNEYDIFEYGILIITQGHHMSEWSITCLSCTKFVCM